MKYIKENYRYMILELLVILATIYIADYTRPTQGFGGEIFIAIGVIAYRIIDYKEYRKNVNTF